jgi:hypothetical protein
MPHLLSTTIQDAVAMARWFDFNPSGGLKASNIQAGFGKQRYEFCVYRRLNQ